MVITLCASTRASRVLCRRAMSRNGQVCAADIYNKNADGRANNDDFAAVRLKYASRGEKLKIGS